MLKGSKYFYQKSGKLFPPYNYIDVTYSGSVSAPSNAHQKPPEFDLNLRPGVQISNRSVNFLIRTFFTFQNGGCNSSILIFINPIPTDVLSNENRLQGCAGRRGKCLQGPTISLLLIHGMLYIFEQRI